MWGVCLLFNAANVVYVPCVLSNKRKKVFTFLKWSELISSCE